MIMQHFKKVPLRGTTGMAQISSLKRDASSKIGYQIPVAFFSGLLLLKVGRTINGGSVRTKHNNKL